VVVILKVTFMTNLAVLPLASMARIVALALDEGEANRVRAVGVYEDEAIVVLRRAPFGGPIHVRTSSGGEFALDRRIAQAITVEVADELQEAAE
jgi:ferrous iron transport protein A